MSALNIFGCNEISMSGIKKFKLANMDVNGVPLVFPLDIVLKTNDESTIMLTDDEANQIITIGTQEIKYRVVYPIAAGITEEEVTDRRGRFYEQKLSWDMPKLNLTTINQLKAALFSISGEFSTSNACCFIEDMNGKLWCLGYSQPMILESFDMATGVEGEENKYTISYTCRSYSKIRQYELIAPFPPAPPETYQEYDGFYIKPSQASALGNNEFESFYVGVDDAN